MLVYFLVTFSIGCSKKLSHSRVYSPLGMNEVQCSNRRVVVDPIHAEIEDLYKRSESLFLSFYMEKNDDFLDELINFSKTPLEPQIISLKKIKNHYLKFKELPLSWGEDGRRLSTFLFEGDRSIDIHFEEPKRVAKYLDGLSKLRQMSDRFKLKSCNLLQLKGQKSRDIRDFFNLKKMIELGQSELVGPLKKKVCHKLSISCDQSNEEVLAHYHDKKIKPLFSLQNWGFKDIQCTKGEKKKYQIRIPSHPSYISELKGIESFWESEELEIRFYPHSRGVKIKEEPNGPSYVRHADIRTIHIDSRLNPMMRERILAHEFGHVLGFEDCYVEFYNQDKEIIYYEIDNTNLMCSGDIGARILPQYTKILISNYCRP